MNDLDIDPMTLIVKCDLEMVKMYHHIPKMKFLYQLMLSIFAIIYYHIYSFSTIELSAVQTPFLVPTNYLANLVGFLTSSHT